ncbi:MAG: hypothetical protein V1904_09330 [Bacteroidota bacterium]
MKVLLIIFSCFSLLVFLAIASCNDSYDSDSVDCSTYDYSDCVTSEPYDGRMYVKLTINDENINVPIAIYRGNLEDNDLYLADTAKNEYYDTLLPVDGFYTVTAEYKRNGEKIFAVDGDDIKKSHADVCDSVCWDVKTGSVNLRLK